MAKKLSRAERKRQSERASKKAKAKANSQPPPDRSANPPSTPTDAVPAPGIVDEVKPQAGNDSSTEQVQDKQPDWCRRNWKKINWDLVFSGCLVFFALVSTVIAKLQWDAMEIQTREMIKQSTASTIAADAAQRSVEDSIVSSRAQLRAYIGLRMSIDRIEPSPDGEYEDVTCRLVIKNHGQTPALAVTVNTLCDEIVPVGEVAAPSDCAPAPEGPLELAPQQGHTITINHRFQTEPMQAIRDGTHAWVVNFVVTYKDVFGVEQRKAQVFRAGGYAVFAVGEVQGGEDAGISENWEPSTEVFPGPAPTPADELPPGYIPAAPEAPAEPEPMPDIPEAPEGAPAAPEAPPQLSSERAPAAPAADAQLEWEQSLKPIPSIQGSNK